MLRDLLDTGVDFGWKSNFLIKYERMYFYYKIIIYIAK